MAERLELRPSVLTIAGSDSSGGAGIQADLKTCEALGVYGQSVITAATAQNTQGVLGAEELPSAFVSLQMVAVFADIIPAAVKIGMIPSAECAHAVAQTLTAVNAQNIVCDPVMVATSGAELSSNRAMQVCVEELFPLACLVTPNIAEAEALAEHDIRNERDMMQAARIIQERGARAVLVKGGHMGCDTPYLRRSSHIVCDDSNALTEGPFACDVLLDEHGGITWFTSAMVATKNTHGTGCTLSSAIASYLARGCSLVQAIQNAKTYLTEALQHEIHLGKGSGPLNHSWSHTKL